MHSQSTMDVETGSRQTDVNVLSKVAPKSRSDSELNLLAPNVDPKFSFRYLRLPAWRSYILQRSRAINDTDFDIQDLTFCYLHMTSQDLQILDTLGTSDYIKGELSDDGKKRCTWWFGSRQRSMIYGQNWISHRTWFLQIPMTPIVRFHLTIGVLSRSE